MEQRVALCKENKEIEIERRIQFGRVVFRKLKNTQTNKKILQHLKAKLWMITKQITPKLRVTQRARKRKWQE